MEIFSGAFGPYLVDRLYLELAELQEKLGKIIDHKAAIEQLSQWLQQFKDGDRCELVSKLIGDEKQSLDAEHKAFSEYWTPERSKRLRRQFARELKPTESVGRHKRLSTAEHG